MKRVDLARTIERLGCVLVRHGGRHDWYRNPATGLSQPVPRHREIKDHLARHIISALSNTPNGDAEDNNDISSSGTVSRRRVRLSRLSPCASCLYFRHRPADYTSPKRKRVNRFLQNSTVETYHFRPPWACQPFLVSKIQRLAMPTHATILREEISVESRNREGVRP